MENFELYWAINEFLIGIILLCCDIGEEPTYAVWAVWSILRETIEFKEQTSLWKEHIPTYISTLESLVVIVLSVVLLATLAQHHARIHLVLLIIELVATAILPLVHEYLLEKRKQ